MLLSQSTIKNKNKVLVVVKLLACWSLVSLSLLLSITLRNAYRDGVSHTVPINEVCVHPPFFFIWQVVIPQKILTLSPPPQRGKLLLSWRQATTTERETTSSLVTGRLMPHLPRPCSGAMFEDFLVSRKSGRQLPHTSLTLV